MQAHRLRAADALHHTQVVKTLVDHPTQSVAFLLADASAVLFGLTPSFPASSTERIPAPCSDACFLHLQARRPSFDPSPAATTPRHPVISRAGAKGFSVSGVEPTVRTRTQAGSSVEASVGLHSVVVDEEFSDVGAGRDDSYKVLARGNDLEEAPRPPNWSDRPLTDAQRSQVFFIATRPGSGGSCVDLMAWHCEPPRFSAVRTQVASAKLSENRMDIGARGPSSVSRKVARLDVPHGMTVKLAASVNFVAIYSVVAGKVWIMGAKVVEASSAAGNTSMNQMHSDTLTATKLPEGSCETESKEVRQGSGVGAKQVGVGKQACLQLVRCAVVDCNTPVYSLHLSMQHMLLGEAGGIRVFPLLPLLKPKKKLGKQKEGTRSKDGVYLLDHNISRISAGLVDSGFGQFADDQEAGSNCDKHRDDPFQEGNSHMPEDRGWPAVTTTDSGQGSSQLPTKSGHRNGISELRIVIGSQRKLDDERLVSLSGSFQCEEEPSVVPKHQDSEGAVGYVLEDFIAGNRPELRENLESDGAQELCGHLSGRGSEKIPQSSASLTGYGVDNCLTFETSSHAQGYHFLKTPDDRKNGYIPQSGRRLIVLGGHSCRATHEMGLAPLRQVDSPFCGEQNQTALQGAHRFVALAGSAVQEGLSFRTQAKSQVVDIQALCAKKFIVLDSSGKLHLMILQNIGLTRERLDGCDLRIRPLKTSLSVSSITVLPLSAQAGAMSSRRLWLADGGHTVHIVSLPMDRGFDGRRGEGISAGSDSQLKLSVSQVLFTNRPVSGLVATSSNSVMVLSPGGAGSPDMYVMAGA